MTDEWRVRLCEPCMGEVRPDDPGFRRLPDHGRRQGSTGVWCECWTELLIEAEET